MVEKKYLSFFLYKWIVVCALPSNTQIVLQVVDLQQLSPWVHYRLSLSIKHEIAMHFVCGKLADSGWWYHSLSWHDTMPLLIFLLAEETFHNIYHHVIKFPSLLYYFLSFFILILIIRGNPLRRWVPQEAEVHCWGLMRRKVWTTKGYLATRLP